MEILGITIVFIIAMSFIINFIRQSIKEGEICQCDSKPSGCHKSKDCHPKTK